MHRSLTRVTHRRLLSTQVAAVSSPDKLVNARLAERPLAEPTPKSVYRIPIRSQPVGNASAVIRDIGCSRRVFLLEPALDSEELEGLAHRIQMLTRNAGLNSVLIANDDSDDRVSNCMPALVTSERVDDALAKYLRIKKFNHKIKHVSQGYDPLKVYTSGMYQDKAALHELFEGLTKLAKACRGDDERSKLPVITLPHGTITDGGYAICFASYVIVTDESSFTILNPSRGLAFDPIGFSHILPRLGWDFKQHSAHFPGCGILLACSGIEASCHDMMYTGLATNYMNEIRRLGPLECSLADLNPWSQQKLIKPTKLTQGQDPPRFDENESVRNAIVANTIECVSNYSVFTSILDEEEPPDDDDPTTNLDHYPYLGTDHPTPLIDRAIVFSKIFKEEQTIHGIVERFKEEAGRTPDEVHTRANCEAAALFVEAFESQSPLALSVVFKLLQMGARTSQTLDSCIERETRTQINMYGTADFKNWAQHTLANGQDEPFKGWTHKSLKDVSQDEVDELIDPSKDLPPLLK